MKTKFTFVKIILLFALPFCSTLSWGQIIKSGEQQEARSYDAGTFRPLLGGKETQGTYAICEITERTTYFTSLHRHNTFDESFYVLEGYLTVYMNEKTQRLGPGSFVFIPKGTPHAQGNLDPQPVRILGMIAPIAAFEGFMYDRVELAKTIKRDNPDFGKRMAEIARKYDLEVLGPAPIMP